MPNNDTQNIYSTPFNEGEAQPIPASRISYDGTGTSIEATNVQAAITEADTDLQSAKNDISDIKDAIRNKWVVKEWNYEEVAGDGTKTYKEILNEIATNMNAKLAALADDEKLVSLALTFGGTYTLPIPQSAIFTNADTFALQCGATVARSSSVISYYSYIAATDSVFRNANTTSSSTTFTDQSNTALDNTHVIRYEYIIYKQV